MAPTIPRLCVIASFAFICIPIIGFGLANIAHRRADEALDGLPRGRRSRSARQHLERDKRLAIISVYINVVIGLTATTISIIMSLRR